jgi:hypothetical protein
MSETRELIEVLRTISESLKPLAQWHAMALKNRRMDFEARGEPDPYFVEGK